MPCAPGPRIGSLFTGTTALDVAVRSRFGGSVVWHSDNDPSVRRLLEWHHPLVPNHGDITSIDWENLERVDILTGGFPCQDVSNAGLRAGMMPSNRSGLWAHMARGIAILRPSTVVIENVRGLLNANATPPGDIHPRYGDLGERRPLRAIGAVLGELAGLGYDAQWCGLPASGVGAPHGRYRVIVIASDTRRQPVREQPGRGNGEHDGTVPVSARAETAPDTDSQRFPRQPEQHVCPDESRFEASHREHAVRCGATAPDTDRPGLEGAEHQGRRLVSPRSLAANSDSVRPFWGGRSWSGPGGRAESSDMGGRDLHFGEYDRAVRRWECVLARFAPTPTMLNRNGNPQLAPAFPEWMMGYPEGWVTDVPGLSRSQQLRMIGNGVCAQQISAGLWWMT